MDENENAEPKPEPSDSQPESEGSVEKYQRFFNRVIEFYQLYLAVNNPAIQRSTDFDEYEQQKKKLVWVAEDIRPHLEKVLADPDFVVLNAEVTKMLRECLEHVNALLSGKYGDSFFEYKTDDEDEEGFSDRTWN